MLGFGSLDPQKPLLPPPKLPLGEREALAQVTVAHPEAVGAPHGWEHAHNGKLVDKIHLLHAAKLWLSLVGINVDDYGNGTYDGAVAKFLNRILGLEVSRQQYLFDYFARYLEKTIKAAIRAGQYQKGIMTLAGRSVAFSSHRVVAGVPTPSVHDLVMHDVAVDVGMDFEAALAKLDESRSSAKDEAVEIDDDDDDDAARRASGSHGWISTRGSNLRVTNVSGGAAGFRAPTAAAKERFGDRDGFRLLHPNGHKPGGICLVIEVGEASMRGLSVKTDTFLVYRPDRSQVMGNWIGQLKASEPRGDAQAKRLWNAAFDARQRQYKERLLTGPVLHIYPQIIQAQRATDAYNKERGPHRQGRGARRERQEVRRGPDRRPRRLQALQDDRLRPPGHRLRRGRRARPGAPGRAPPLRGPQRKKAPPRRLRAHEAVGADPPVPPKAGRMPLPQRPLTTTQVLAQKSESSSSSPPPSSSSSSSSSSSP